MVENSNNLDSNANFNDFNLQKNLQKLTRNVKMFKGKNTEKEKEEPPRERLPPIGQGDSTKTLNETPKLTLNNEESEKEAQEDEEGSVSMEEEEFKGRQSRDIRISEESKEYSDSEKEYDLGNVITLNQTGKISRALHFNTAKLIIVRTLEYSSLSDEQISARLDYIKENLDLLKEITSPNIIEYI